MVGAAKTVAIKSPTTSVDLDVPRPKLEGALKDLAQPGTVQLTLRDITADSHPGVLFHVYLAKKDDPASRQHVGTISWFGAFRHRHGGQSGPEKKTRTFDVTDEPRALGGSAAASGLTVVIEATHGRTSANPEKLQTHREEANKAFRAESIRPASPGPRSRPWWRSSRAVWPPSLPTCSRTLSVSTSCSASPVTPSITRARCNS